MYAENISKANSRNKGDSHALQLYKKRLLPYNKEMKLKRHSLLSYFGQNLLIVVGLVMIWRGIWYVLDWVDITFLSGNHIITAVGGIIGGLLILYLPDKDLKEIQKL